MDKTLTAAAVAVAAVAAAAAVPALSTADDAPVREITVREQLRAVTFVQQSASTGEDRLAPGDRVLTRQTLRDPDGRPLGTLTTDCVNVGAKTAPFFSALLQCSSTYALRDGQVVAAGTVRFDRPQSARLPITGGSGAYRTARGEVVAGEGSGPRETVAVLRIER